MELRDALSEYEYGLSGAGEIIFKSGKASGVFLKLKKGRIQARSVSGNLIWSGMTIGGFVKKFWFAEKVVKNGT